MYIGDLRFPVPAVLRYLLLRRDSTGLCLLGGFPFGSTTYCCRLLLDGVSRARAPARRWSSFELSVTALRVGCGLSLASCQGRCPANYVRWDSNAMLGNTRCFVRPNGRDRRRESCYPNAWGQCVEKASGGWCWLCLFGVRHW